MSSKNILVVGGSHGIGLNLVKQLLNNNHNVLVASRTNDNLTGLNVQHIAFDATSDEFNTDLIPETLNGLIYAPGSINLKPFHRISLAEFQADLDVNYFGAIRVLQALHKQLKKANNSSVVLVSTVAVQTGMPFHASIAGAKGAVEGLTKSLAAEWAPRVRVNAVAPALVDTRLSEKLLSTDDKKEASNKRHPLNRYGSPSDISNAIQFLLSDESSWMTGQILGVDGGMSSVKI